jgi:hypothetical protein
LDEIKELQEVDEKSVLVLIKFSLENKKVDFDGNILIDYSFLFF